MVRNNLDVIHIDKNLFDNIIMNTILTVQGKTKDNFEVYIRLDGYLHARGVTCDGK